MTFSAPIYEIVKFLVENAAELASRRVGPVFIVHEFPDCYRVHKREVIPAIMDIDPDLNTQLSFVVNELFHKQASFDRSSQWFTIFKPSSK